MSKHEYVGSFSYLVGTVAGWFLGYSSKEIDLVTEKVVSRFLSSDNAAQRNNNTIERVEAAKDHIDNATTIITGLQTELKEQSTELDKLISEIEDKKAIAIKYSDLAKVNKQASESLRIEISETLNEFEIMS